MREEKEKKWKQQLLKALDAEAEKIEQRAGPCQSPLRGEKGRDVSEHHGADPAVWGGGGRFRGGAGAAGSSFRPERSDGKPFWKHPCGWPASCWP